MKILLVHNFYPVTGGEESVLLEEKELLKQAGHEILEFYIHTKERGLRDFILCALTLIWNPYAYHRIKQIIRTERPDVIHCHNTFPMTSPSVYWAAARERVPVIQTLHNYRLVCANAAFLRDGKVCEDCSGKRFAWPAVKHKCYRGSRTGSLLLAVMQWIHREIGTWTKKVHTYIALTEFSKSRFVESGILRPEQIAVKPNFIGNPPVPVADDERDQLVVFAGRLSEEKGCEILVRAWIEASRQSEQFQHYTLCVIGDGEQMPRIRQLVQDAGDQCTIELAGSQPREDVLQKMRRSRFLVLPSIWYEGFPMTILEAFSCGVPVISSDLGSMQSIIEEGKTGLLFDPGGVKELADKLLYAVSHEDDMLIYGKAARLKFEQLYTRECNAAQLLNIYSLTGV